MKAFNLIKGWTIVLGGCFLITTFLTACETEEETDLEAPQVEAEDPGEPTLDLVDQGLFEGLSTWTDMIVEADMVEMVKTDGPYTIFAPHDDAFGELLPDHMGQLMDPDQTELVAALVQIHIVEGEITEEQLRGETSVETMAGVSIEVREENGTLYFGDAEITETDVNATNGVIHIINEVILPEDLANGN